MPHHQEPTPPPIVTVFGSSRAQPDDPEYEAARRLGRLLAERGWTICNGGNEGTMEASARGAKEAGGATIGVTIGLYRGARPNPWLDEEIAVESLFLRLEQLVTLGQAFVVLRGAIGTLLEMCLIWNLSHLPQWSHKPIVVVGTEWQSIAMELRANLPFHPWEWNTLTFVSTVDEAVEHLASRYPWTDSGTED